MRPLRRSAIAAFLVLATPVLGLALASGWWCARALSLPAELHGVGACVVALLCTCLYALAGHRLLLWAAPLNEGPIAVGGAQEWRYQLYSLQYLFLFNSLIRSRVIPIPLMRVVYLALGARLGAGSYSAGIIFDPIFVTIGADTLVGEAALLVPHVIEGGALAHHRIVLGDGVTIGACAVVLAGARIGDGAIVAANSVVAKHTCIPAGEIWGGTPARRLRARQDALYGLLDGQLHLLAGKRKACTTDASLTTAAPRKHGNVPKRSAGP